MIQHEYQNMNINTINVVKCIDVKIFRTLMVRSTTKSYEKNFRKKISRCNRNRTSRTTIAS